MAPNNAQTKKKKERNLVSPGRVGTRTGLTLPERPRDEYGLEDPKGLFDTSPATTVRSTRSTKTTARKSNEANDYSDAMEIQESSAPDPTETLTERRAANAKGRLTPAGKTPIKTPGLGPARRGSSLGPISSPLRQTQTPGRASTQSPRRRLLDFTRPENASTGQHSPRRSITPNKSASRTYGSATKARSSVFDPIFSPSGNQVPIEDDNMDDDGSDDEPVPYALEDSALPAFEDDEGAPVEEDLANSQLVQEQALSSTTKRKGTRRSRASDVSQVADVVETTAVVEDETDTKAKGKRGRPPKAANSTQSKTKKPAKALGEKDGNIQRLRQQDGSETNNFAKPGVPMSMQRQREQTPFDDGQLHTRSGRASFRPLQYWKGERAVFVPNKREEIQTIIRMDDVTPIKRKINRSRSPQKARKRRKREYSVFEEEPDDDGEEPWEIEEGVISGPVKLWNAELGIHADEEQEQELAFAARRIEAREADGANFLFAKTLTTPFFGSGIVELPPQGFKTLKNSRHFQMVFFVHYGKVVVEAATKKSGEATRFVITKGGMWQIPRGNFYSIANETDRPAKIFFAQGRELMPEPVAALDLKELSR